MAAIATHSSGARWWMLRGEGSCGVFAGKTVWSTPERLRGQVLAMRRYTNLRLPLHLPYCFLNTFTLLFQARNLLVTKVLSYKTQWTAFGTFELFFGFLTLFNFLLLLPTLTISVAVCTTFEAVFVCLFVCPQHNSKTNDPEVLKVGAISSKWHGLGWKVKGQIVGT